MASRLLVVDDDLLIRRMFTDAFTECGWEVEAVENADRALEVFEGTHFDALLIDKNMPGMSGIDLVQEIRTKDERVVCAIITAYPSAESAMRALQLDIDAYIEKPAPDPIWVVDRIDELVRKRSQRAALLEVSRSPGLGRGERVLRALVATGGAVDSGALESWLRRDGIVVETVMSPSPAAMARALDRQPQLLLLDIALARPSVATYLAELRAAGFAAACVILAEKSPALESLIEFIDLEVAAVIEKPVDPDDLDGRLGPVVRNLQQ